ncbi:MAG: glycoside hydrolase [Puniceicoccales bacterium]|jgi:sialidase-1|nr:glycoside hydrolase [Puniceicoccales bacterium]
MDLYVGTGQSPTHTYRIPTLCVTTKNTILAFAELRKNGAGDSGDIDTVVRRSEDGGKTWSKETVVLDIDNHTMGNACPIVDPDSGRITLVAVWNRVHEYKTAPGYGDDSRLVYVTHSDDDGNTWSKPRNISRDVKQPDWGWYATGPGAGIVKKFPPHAGRYIIGVNHNVPAEKGAYYAHALYSDDSGKTWKSSSTFAARGTNECEVVELSNGDLMLNMRNQSTGHRNRAISISKDGGGTWSETAYDSQLPEPVCQGSIVRHSWPDGKKPGLILFCNPASQTKRENLILRGSYDEGKTWPIKPPANPGLKLKTQSPDLLAIG